MIEIDGSHGEGGGAILRTALALSTITNKPFRIKNIRHSRPNPGLKREHLYCIRILQQLSKAKVEDAHLGSESIMFVPGEVKSKKIEYDLETAASTTLVAQCIILSTIFTGKRVSLELIGGTDVKWSIPADYLANVVAPALKPLGDIIVRIQKRGYYPKGSGKLTVSIKGHERMDGSALPKLTFIERGNSVVIQGSAHASVELEKAEVAGRMKATVDLLLKEADISQSYSVTKSTGACVTLWARYEHTTLGASGLGEKGVKAETIAENAVKELQEYIGSKAVVDSHLADQLTPYLALCGGSLKTNKITGHVKSNIYVCEQFLDVKFEIDEEKGIVKTVST
ncbi:RNA 3'-terminal phosphate cyclase [Candidatus Woesearchaeota archaeon]|nr:RNA 3'-terminal phosphate cyclase [Candidatus Woesearchaeota archaeon]